MKTTQPATLFPNGWSVEWRADLRKWEVMQGSAHRGLYDSEPDAIEVVKELGK